MELFRTQDDMSNHNARVVLKATLFFHLVCVHTLPDLGYRRDAPEADIVTWL